MKTSSPITQADIERYRQSISTMRQALDNKTPESEKSRFNVLDVKNYLTAWKGSTVNGPVFRSRLISKKRLSKMEGTVSISEFSYPPKSASIANKCNTPDQPVTYCSSDFRGAVTETIFSKGNPEIKPNYHFFVSEWTIEETPASIFNIQERIPSNDPRPADEREVINQYLETLEKCFTNRQGYAFSSQFAHDILFGTPEKTLEIIEYPGIVKPETQPTTFGENWHNYAIVPSFFDKYKFHRVHLIKTPTLKEVSNIDSAAFQFLLVGYPDPDHPGIVRWKTPEKLDMPEITSGGIDKGFFRKMFPNGFETDGTIN